MGVEWVKVRSWHAIRFDSRTSMHRTLCGRWASATAETQPDLPAGKSCESCLRIVARLADQNT